MRSKLILIALATSARGLQTRRAGGAANRGVESVNVPVVTGNDYVLDAAAPNGALSGADAERV